MPGAHGDQPSRRSGLRREPTVEHTANPFSKSEQDKIYVNQYMLHINYTIFEVKSNFKLFSLTKLTTHLSYLCNFLGKASVYKQRPWKNIRNLINYLPWTSNDKMNNCQISLILDLV